ncbi:MAG: TolC family protein [Acidobacteriaceae bacterium]|jgi:outer membrane protein TolC
MRSKSGGLWGTGLGSLMLLGLTFSCPRSHAQVQAAPAQVNSNTYQGSLVKQAPVPGVLPLTLDQAIRMGLQYNLGLVLSSTNAGSAGAQQLQQLQALLPTVNASAKEAAQQTNLQAEGLKIPGFPAVIGPYGYTDIRASLQWSLLNLSSLDNYLAAKHNFQGSRLSIEDAKDMVVLTVGNAYLLCIADASRVQSAQAQVNTSKVSLDQAVANHQAGTAPLLDELRARVDYQTQQQTLITAQNQYEKDKIALARAIGLPLEQSYELSDQAPFQALDNLDPNAAVQQGLTHRHDLQALQQQVASAQAARSGATAERYPTISISGDYGVIGPTLGHSRGTFDAVGTASVPLFEEAKLRGDARDAQAQLETKQAQLNDLRGQISADVRDSILDIQAAAKQVAVSRSNVELATEALSEAQQRYAAGVADNLAVSQAQASMAQADDQLVSSLYQHNVAKLSLARAMGIAQTNYKDYVGGK